MPREIGKNTPFVFYTEILNRKGELHKVICIIFSELGEGQTPGVLKVGEMGES